MDWVHVLNLHSFAQDFPSKWWILNDILSAAVFSVLSEPIWSCQPQEWDIHIPISMNFI